MKILVRATNWVGDAVLSLPALWSIRGRWRDAEIVILARSYVAELYGEQGVADRLWLDDFQGRHGGMRGRERLASEVGAERFDVALLLTNSFDSAWVVWRARIPERIGYARDGRGHLLTRAIPTPRPGEIPAHESCYYLELLRRAGWTEHVSVPEQIELRVSGTARRQALNALENAGARRNGLRVACGPGASYGSAKCWLPERYAELADHLIETVCADVILFGTAAETSLLDAIASSMRHQPVNLAGRTRIGELPAYFSECNLFIGNDSGAMHVAAAVGLPVVAVFGSTDAEGTAPVTRRLSVVQEKVFCSPCFLRRCPIDHRCMNRVTVEMVESAARKWLPTGSAARA
jgi:heptosyltransferase-2